MEKDRRGRFIGKPEGYGKAELGIAAFLTKPVRQSQMLDAIRIAPKTARAFEAGPEGLEFIAFGPHREADGELVDDGWAG